MNLIASFECELKGRPVDLIAVSGRGEKEKKEKSRGAEMKTLIRERS